MIHEKGPSFVMDVVCRFILHANQIAFLLQGEYTDAGNSPQSPLTT